MNYLAHGYRFVDSPLYAAGTAVPDWLCVADRRVRVRSRRLRAEIPRLQGNEQLLALGMLQHLQDDDTFHRHAVFMMLEAETAAGFRRQMPDRFDHRPGFLGHILTELLLDACLAEQQPELLNDYYAAISEVDPLLIQNAVNLVATRPTSQLVWFVDRFCEARFLYDYLDDGRLLERLNQVLRRVTLPALDEQCLPVLRDARALVRQHAALLLSDVAAVGTVGSDPDVSSRDDYTGSRVSKAVNYQKESN